MSAYWEKPYKPGGDESYEDAKVRFGKLIKEEDIQHWHDHGYVVIKQLFSPDTLKEIHEGLQKYMPTWEEYDAHRPRYRDLHGSERPTSGIVRFEFPYLDDALNQAAVHPFLSAFAEKLSGSKGMMLSHGAITGKYAGKGDYDQALHADYSNNTPVVPSKGTKSIDVPMIIYHSDVTIDLGPTYVVGWEHTEHRNFVSDGFRHHPRETFPDLYKVEKPNLVPAGSVLIYSKTQGRLTVRAFGFKVRTFHRGSAMTAKAGARYIQFTAFHSANTPWMGSLQLRTQFGTPQMNHFLLHADPAQRALAGFPPADDEYWKDPENVKAVGNRYPGMDMRPYGGDAPKANGTS